MSRVPYLPSLQKIANADAVDGNERSPYHDDFALDRIEQALRGADRVPRRAAAPAARRARARTCCTRPRSTRKPCSGSRRTSPTTVPKERLSQQAEIALASFKAGVCVSANLTIGQFDSHANNDRRSDEADPRVPRRHRAT